MEPLLLRMGEAAKLCSVSRAKLYKMVHEGHIPAVKFGRSLRIPYDGLKRLIESGSSLVEPTAPTGRGR